MSELTDKILSLTRQLYPQGRAWKMPADGFLEKLHKGLSVSEEKALTDSLSILYDILPDNDNFTADDATDWERRLGLITNSITTLSDRKLAIKNKLNQPGIPIAHQNFRYLQDQLNENGFTVFVYENKFLDYPSLSFVTKTPEEVSGLSNLTTPVQHGQYQHGQFRHGANYNNKIVNYIDEKKDLPFNFDSAFRNTFFVCGSPVGTIANVPATRKDEFRQLILKVKPVQTVGFLFINYI